MFILLPSTKTCLYFLILIFRSLKQRDILYRVLYSDEKDDIYIFRLYIYKQKWFNHSTPISRNITSLIQSYIKGWHLIILQFQQRMIFHSVFMMWIFIFIKEMLLKTTASYFSCQTSWQHSLSYLVSASLWNHPPSSFFTSRWMAHPATTTIPLTFSLFFFPLLLPGTGYELPCDL